MPNLKEIEKLEEKLDELFHAVINKPVDFKFVLNILKYVDFVESSPMLMEMVEREHDDLAETRRRIPKALNDRQYELMGLILDIKLCTNISEDFTELTFTKEAFNEFKLQTPEEYMFSFRPNRPTRKTLTKSIPGIPKRLSRRKKAFGEIYG